MAADLAQLATDERRDLADFLAVLGADQWSALSLCSEWNVSDVVAHIISYDELSVTGIVGAFVQGHFKPQRINQNRLEHYRDRSPDQLLTLLSAHLEPRGFTAWFGGGIGLSDCVIHHQDIRRALNQPRQIPAERLLPVLKIAMTAPVLPARHNAKGLRFSATDLDWNTGTGPEVTGPAEAILMTLAGRTDALADLAGPGLQTLQSRLQPASTRTR